MVLFKELADAKLLLYIVFIITCRNYSIRLLSAGAFGMLIFSGELHARIDTAVGNKEIKKDMIDDLDGLG